jgi:hypothetical protein
MAAQAATIHLTQMDELLAPLGYTTITLPGVNEIVYARGTRYNGTGWELPLSIRIYTTIEGTESRSVGEDAIHVSVWVKRKHPEGEGIYMLGGSKRVHRVMNWRHNLLARLRAWNDMLDPWCPNCKAPMILRKPKNGQHWQPFYGCCRFPECGGTRLVKG